MSEIHTLYSLTSFLIRIYKWVELKILKLFSVSVEQDIRKTYQKAGVKFFGQGILDKSNKVKREAKNKWDIEIHNTSFFTRIANQATLAMAETYMDGDWDCEDLVELTNRIFKHNVYVEYLNPWNRFLNYLELSFFNLQSKARAWEVGRKHYDIGNDLFESFLDPWMTYSCGYWKDADNLNDAQINKMELIAKKLKLKPGMRVLDIGCGYGGLCKYLAEKHGVECVGITISEEGVKYGREKCKGLPVDLRLMDYRDLDEVFDRVVSVGMVEHVGKHNYRTFFEIVHRCLSETGIFVLHTIGNNHKYIPAIEPFYHTYIFPNGSLPYYLDIAKYTEGLYVLEDWHNFGYDYSKTLIAWKENFVSNWPKISHKYGQRFFRLWTFYLQFSAGCFQSRRFQLWQIVLSKNGVEGGYQSVR